MNPETSPDLIVPDGYDRRVHKGHYRVRPLTLADVIRSTPTGEIKITSPDGHMVSTDGQYRRIKINGRVRTWKRDPTRVEIPCKYGMYEHATFEWGTVTHTFHPFGSSAFLCVILEYIDAQPAKSRPKAGLIEPQPVPIESPIESKEISP